MTKRLFGALVLVGVMAFVLTATAVASEATYPKGTRAPLGTGYVKTGKNITLTTAALGEITCKTLNLTGSITKNNGTEIEGSGNNVNPTQAGCFNGMESRPLTVTEVNVTKLFSNISGKGTASSTATVDLPAGVTCKFTAANIPGTYTPGTNVLVFSKAGPVTSTGGCGNATIDGQFSLERSGTTNPVILD